MRNNLQSGNAMISETGFILAMPDAPKHKNDTNKGNKM